jgi:hypothetical protein
MPALHPQVAGLSGPELLLERWLAELDEGWHEGKLAGQVPRRRSRPRAGRTWTRAATSTGWGRWPTSC